MADEDVQVSPEEGIVESTGETEVEEAKKSFFKSKLFLIIAGVIILLLIAGGAYFFLAPANEAEDPVAESETISEENISEKVESDLMSESDDMDSIEDELELNLIDAPDDSTNESGSTIVEPVSQQQSTELKEKTDKLQEQNMRMQQQIKDLEAKINQQEMIKQDQQSIQESNIIAPIRNASSVDYQQDFYDDSSMREPNRTPPPKPSWGEFDRIKKK